MRRGEGHTHALSRAAWRAALVLTGGLLLTFLALPIAALFGTLAPGEIGAALASPVVWPALRLSLLTTAVSLTIVVVTGTPLAWLLARRSSRAARTIETFVQLPAVIPPAVAGVALLLAFGRRGLLAPLTPEGWAVTFTTAAVVLAETFVSAPFFLQSAVSAFRRVDEDLVTVARTLGVSGAHIFFRLAIPLAAPGLVAGAAMSWARSLGEFGATLMFAGNLPGRTQTLPLAIYAAMETDLRAAKVISVILVLFALALLLVVRAAARRLDTPEAERREVRP